MDLKQARKINIIKAAAEFHRQMSALVCQRFCAGLYDALVELPEVQTVYVKFDEEATAPLALCFMAQGVRSANTHLFPPSPTLPQVQGKEATVALRFENRLHKLCKQLDNPSVSASAVMGNMFQPFREGDEFAGRVDSPVFSREELLRLLPYLLENPHTRLHPHVLADFAAKTLHDATPPSPSPRNRYHRL